MVFSICFNANYLSLLKVLEINYLNTSEGFECSKVTAIIVKLRGECGSITDLRLLH